MKCFFLRMERVRKDVKAAQNKKWRVKRTEIWQAEKPKREHFFPVMCNSAGKSSASVQLRTNQILERDNQIYSSSPCYSRKSNGKVIRNAPHRAFTRWVFGGQIADTSEQQSCTLKPGSAH